MQDKLASVKLFQYLLAVDRDDLGLECHRRKTPANPPSLGWIRARVIQPALSGAFMRLSSRGPFSSSGDRKTLFVGGFSAVEGLVMGNDAAQ